jgi:hypothetical protein
MSVKEQILKLTRQFYPTGRAFRLPNGSYIFGLHSALAESETNTYNDSVAVLNSILPDNEYFTADDATDWERRLSMPTNLATPLPDRMAAIYRKMRAPGTQPAKGNYLYIQTQLQAAGFNVYVYENINFVYPDIYETFNPAVLNPAILTQNQHGDQQHGNVQSGGYINHVVANSIDNSVDIGFNVGNSLRSTFFIGGNTLGTYANVPASREVEFRQLILSLKQVQTIAYLFINYV